MTGKPERKQLAGRSMIIPSYLLTLCALLFLSCGPTVAQSVAVFDFELIDTSLEGAIRGARADERERLARLSDQLRQLLRESGRFSFVDIAPIASEAQASNLQACGGCDMRLARIRVFSAMPAGTFAGAVFHAQRNGAQMESGLFGSSSGGTVPFEQPLASRPV